MATELPFPTARKLALVCGMFGSDHAGERASAALQAHRILKDAGLTWLQALGIEPIKPASQDKAWEHAYEEPPPPRPIPDKIMLQVCLDRIENYSEWEAGFLRSIADQMRRGFRLSPKQRAKLQQIYERMDF